MNATSIDGPRLAPATGGKPKALVILLHGYGSNGADLISLAHHWRDALPDTAFVAPNAPQRCPSAPGGFQWWALTNINRQEMVAGANRVLPVLDAFLDAELASAKLDESQLLLVGFSQGTMLALHCGPRRERVVAGIVGYSGMLADPAGLSAALRSRPPILLVHGSDDPVVPVSALHEAKAELHRLGFDVAEHISAGLGHGVDPHGLALGRDFAKKVLAER